MNAILEYPNLQIKRMTQGALPQVLFRDIKEEILGPKYDLSIIFESCKKMEELHMTHLNLPGSTTILSFPLDENSGEIIIGLNQSRLHAKKWGHTHIQNLAYLLIHGCLHLAGYDHSNFMTKLEIKYAKKFSIPHELIGLRDID